MEELHFAQLKRPFFFEQNDEHRHPMPGNRHTKRPDSIRQNRNRGRDTGRGTEQRKAGIRCRGKEERNEYYKLCATTASASCIARDEHPCPTIPASNAKTMYPHRLISMPRQKYKDFLTCANKKHKKTTVVGWFL